MSFKEAYGYYTQGGQILYQAEGSMGYSHDQGIYYTLGMGTSQGPHVGQSGPQVSLSVSAHFKFDNPVTRGLSDLTTWMNALELLQEEIGHNLENNTSLTQESWGMLSSMHYNYYHGT